MSVPADFDASVPGSVADAVTDVLGERCAEGLTLPGVAAILGMSPRTLQRRLAASGFSFLWIQANIRWYTAAQALIDGPSVARAAQLTGYSTASGFCQAFKGRFGVTPGLFREAVRNDHRAGGLICADLAGLVTDRRAYERDLEFRARRYAEIFDEMTHFGQEVMVDLVENELPSSIVRAYDSSERA